jgi:hypothetical protein
MRSAAITDFKNTPVSVAGRPGVPGFDSGRLVGEIVQSCPHCFGSHGSPCHRWRRKCHSSRCGAMQGRGYWCSLNGDGTLEPWSIYADIPLRRLSDRCRDVVFHEAAYLAT